MPNEQLGVTAEDLKRAKQKMFGWGSLAALSLTTFIYATFFGFVPAYQDYKKLKETLCLEIIKADGQHHDLGCKTPKPGQVTHYFQPWGSAYAAVVDEGETALRDCFNNNAGTECTDVISTLKYHGIGTSSTAVGETDGGCLTELTTQYNPDNTRATGSQTTNGANVYRTIGTNTVDAAATIEEFCLMNTSTGAGIMWTRILTGTITLANGDGLQTTYDLTIS